ncbi:MAG: hypothetical protein VYA51_01060 [Planctomycetota bacterium]|nr:hypothetical protein [Planctomycetota bacterium]
MAAAQSPGRDDPWISESDRRYTVRFQALLLSGGLRDITAGWELAADLGRPVAPLLWRLAARERSNVGKRLALMTAALIAGGAAEDARLFSYLEKDKAMLPERVMASLWVALGPARSRPRPDMVRRFLGPNREPETLLAVAVRLAAARFPGAADDVSQLESNDPGLLAAAVFAGMPVSRSAAARQWRGDHRHAGLYQRGALFGALRTYGKSGVSAQLLDAARATFESQGSRGSGESAAAIMLLGRAGALHAKVGELDWRQLQFAVSQEASMEFIRPHLRAAPYARDPEPARLAVAYALSSPLQQVVNEHTTWSRERSVIPHVAVALAARLCAQPRQERGALTLPSNAPLLAGCPEWSFVVWAAGGTTASARACSDPRLASLWRLVADRRVSRPAAKEELEAALWRWGSHPRLGLWRAERELVRDLLLVGSRSGARYQPELPPHLRYFATGLDRDDAFFDLASALYEFTARPRPPVPSEHRLF